MMNDDCFRETPRYFRRPLEQATEVHVHMSMWACCADGASAAWTMATDLAAVLIDGREPTKRDRHHLISPLANRFRCADEAVTFPDGPSNTLVTIATFPGPGEADLARAALDSAGIESFIQGENANSLLALAFRARLLVHKQDEETARQLLGGASDELTAEEQSKLEAGDDEA